MGGLAGGIFVARVGGILHGGKFARGNFPGGIFHGERTTGSQKFNPRLNQLTFQGTLETKD